jgi:protocatechuate 3,4-dioxygenase beta subunit
MRTPVLLVILGGATLLSGCAVHPYSGVVVDSRGRPVANATVEGWHYAHTFDRDVINHRSEWRIVGTTTDKSGRFELSTHINLDKISASGLYDSSDQPHGHTELENPKFVDNRIVLTRNVIYPTRSGR